MGSFISDTQKASSIVANAGLEPSFKYFRQPRAATHHVRRRAVECTLLSVWSGLDRQDPGITAALSALGDALAGVFPHLDSTPALLLKHAMNEATKGISLHAPPTIFPNVFVALNC